MRACGLEHRDLKQFLKTATKHPRDLSKDGSVGHSWIAIEKRSHNGYHFWEGGHSGELGIEAPKYWDSLLLAQGDENPAKVLWEAKPDGFFQKGSGGHIPTMVAACVIDANTCKKIQHFVQQYDFKTYSLSSHHCVHFVQGALHIAGIDIKTEKELIIPPSLHTHSGSIRLWSDPEYSRLPIALPDTLEQALKEEVRKGNLKNVTRWYVKTHVLWSSLWKTRFENLFKLRERTERWLWTRQIQ